MKFVLTQWFSQPASLPVLFTNFLFLASGFATAKHIGSKKTIIYIMLTALALFFVACAVSHVSFEMFRVYSVYVGAMCLDFCVGAAIGLLAKKPSADKRAAERDREGVR